MQISPTVTVPNLTAVNRNTLRFSKGPKTLFPGQHVAILRVLRFWSINILESKRYSAKMVQFYGAKNIYTTSYFYSSHI